MKLNLSNYDPNEGGKEVAKIQGFVSWCVQSINTLTRVLRNNVALEDNIYGEKQQVTLTSGVTSVLSLTGGIYGITVMRVRGDGLSSFEWGYIGSGRVFVKAEFRDATKPVVVDLFVWRN